MVSKDDSDKPNLLPEGSLAIQIYEELGRALATWGAVEAALAGLYCIAVNHDNPQPAIHSFWAVASFEGKLKLSSAAISVTLSVYPELLTCWKNLHNRLGRKKEIRNKLAHGTVRTVAWKSKKGQKFDCFFAPYGFSVRDTTILSEDERNNPFRDPRPRNRMYYNEIRQAHLSFFQLRHDLWGISDKLYPLLFQKQSDGRASVIRPATGYYSAQSTPTDSGKKPPPQSSQE